MNVSTQVKTAVIDSDAHVLETERTWDYMTEEEQAYKPIILVRQDQANDAEYWLIEGRAFRKNTNQSEQFPRAAREVSDVPMRLAHMDEMGVDVHALYPSVFLRPLTEHPEVEVALSRSYNRWLGDISRQGGGRLRWAVIPPLMDRDAAIAELNFGKENGACAIFVRGLEGPGRLSDPYMYPIYEEAQRLNMPICFHAGIGKFDYFDLFSRDFGFSTFKLPVVGAFHDLLMKRIPAKFPDLRWGFIEISSQFVPYALNDLAIRYRRLNYTYSGRDILKDNNMFVACQTTDDLPYILDAVGDDNIVVGTDYGHNDTATEIDALRRLREDGTIDTSSVDKILSDNPKRLYAL
jgi:predicted TIM-barrel fold metal-dependent hydrolase